jgi:endo-1,4-beta-xylanase
MKTHRLQHHFAGMLVIASAAFFAMAMNANAAPTSPPDRPLSATLTDKAPASLMPEDVIGAMKFRSDASNLPAGTAVWAAAPNGKQVLRVESNNVAKFPDHVSVRWNFSTSAKKGDVALVRFLARAEYARQESGDAMVELTVLQPKPEYTAHAKLPLTVGPTWTMLEAPLTIMRDASPEDAFIQLSFGNLVQAVEIADVQLLNFGSSATIKELPATRFTYKGREADAAWRQAALERIEKIRTAPMDIRVIDANGKPVPNAKVSARLARPAFIFGTEVDAAFVIADTPDAQKHRELLVELFDTAVIGNGMKWPQWTGVEKRAETMRASKWLESQNLRQRGHVLVWPGNKFSPRRIVMLPEPKTELSLMIKEHIRDLMTVNKGRMVGWDVVNEMTHERDYFKYLPEIEAAEWFKLAHSIDPTTKLFINEYGMLNTPNSPKKIAEYLALIERLRAAGAPIHAIGIQGHIGRQPRNPTDVLADLDLLGKAGLELQITEFDINTPDEELQGDYTRDFLIALYSHPSVSGFTMWGFWQNKHWKPDGAMFRSDWSEKPNAKVWRELVRSKWMTKVDSQTDSDGKLNVRGHLGDYEFTVTNGNKTIKQMRILPKEGTAITLQLP